MSKKFFSKLIVLNTGGFLINMSKIQLKEDRLLYSNNFTEINKKTCHLFQKSVFLMKMSNIQLN